MTNGKFCSAFPLDETARVSPVNDNETVNSRLKLSNLPQEILLMIIGYLDEEDCQNLRLVSTDMRRIADDRTTARIAMNFASPWIKEVANRQYIGELVIKDVPLECDLQLKGIREIQKARLLDADHESAVDYLCKEATSLQELNIIGSRFLNQFRMGTSPLQFDRLKSLNRIAFQFPILEWFHVHMPLLSIRFGEFFYEFFHFSNFQTNLKHFSLKSELQTATYSNIIRSLFHFLTRQPDLKSLQFHVPVTDRVDNWSSADHLLIPDINPAELAKIQLSDLDISIDTPGHPIWNQLLKLQRQLVNMKIDFNKGRVMKINRSVQLVYEPVLQSCRTLCSVQLTGMSPLTPFSCSIFKEANGLKKLLLHHVSIHTTLRNRDNVNVTDLDTLPTGLCNLEIVGLALGSEDVTAALGILVNLSYLRLAYCGEGPERGLPVQKLVEVAKDMGNLKRFDYTPGVRLGEEAIDILRPYIYPQLSDEEDATFQFKNFD